MCQLLFGEMPKNMPEEAQVLGLPLFRAYYTVFMLKEREIAIVKKPSGVYKNGG